MTAVDHAELKRLAERCTGGDPWYKEADLCGRQSFIPQDMAFIAAATPAVVLALLSEIEGLKAERERFRTACAKQNDEIQQTLGKALGYPWFKDDQVNFPGATEADGVCVGDHVAESIADEAANRLRTQAPDSWRPTEGAAAKIASEAIDWISDLDNALTEDRVVAGAARKVAVRLRSRLLALRALQQQVERLRGLASAIADAPQPRNASGQMIAAVASINAYMAEQNAQAIIRARSALTGSAQG